jgi:hypothetical protein
MDRKELARQATAASMRASVAEHGRPPADDPHGHGGHAAATVREAEYKGHRIVIRTRYEIEIDGKPLEAHFAVDNAGLVHYHGIPNNHFRSAVDLVKHIVDAFPDDFPPPGTTPKGRGRRTGTRGRAEPGHAHRHGSG